MRVKRVYNNNVALVVDDQGGERIAIGRGLAFGKHPGDEVDPAGIERTFMPDDATEPGRFEQLVRSIPSEYLAVADEIFEMVRTESDLKVDGNLLIALADHISLSLERERAGVAFDNPLVIEIKQFYKREFALAQRAADIIDERLGIRVSEGEVGFIALHIVNASMGERPDTLVLSIAMIQDILDIVAREFSLSYDEDSLQYERFLRHLQFFAMRVLGDGASQSEDTFLYVLGKGQYPEALACTEKIGAYVAERYHRDVTDAEKGYLVFHIMNIVNATEQKGERTDG